MLQELAQYLIDTGKKCVETKVLKHPSDLDKSLVIGPDGVRELETPRMPPRESIECNSEQDFALALASRADELLNEVWYDDGRAVAYSLDPHRYLTVSVDFYPHPIVHSLLSLTKERAFDQRQLVKFLRVELNGCVPDFVLARFRQLNWESVRRSRQVVQHGNASLDAEVKASVTAGDSTAPEEFVVNVPLFANARYASVRFTALVLVDMETETAKIVLTLAPGAVEDLRSAMRQSVHGFLANVLDTDKYTLICGTSETEEQK